MAARCRFLVLDLDGTLVDQDGGVADVDRAAVAQARACGVAVTLATGRLASGALPVARELGLELPVICVDGAALVSPDRGLVLEACALPPATLLTFRAAASRAELAPFMLSPSDLFGTPGPAAAFLRGWSSDVQPWDALAGQAALGPPAPVVACLGVGAARAACAAAAELGLAFAADPELGVRAQAFPLGDAGPWAVRVAAVGADKAVAAARLAERLGVTAAETAAVGDWYNDVRLLGWAGRSFAVADAPAEVKRAAGDVLSGSCRSGGAVAEAIAALLDA